MIPPSYGGWNRLSSGKALLGRNECSGLPGILSPRRDECRSRRHRQFGSGRAVGNGEDAGFFQGAENIADDHRVAAGAFGQQRAGHPYLSCRLMDENQTMHCDRTFHADLHMVHSLLSPLILPLRAFRAFGNVSD